MLNLLIEGKIPHLIKGFLGVFSRDTLPAVKTFPASLISNVEKYGHNGSHWIAIYFDRFGRGAYFDSYGLPPLYPEFIEFLQNYSNGFSWNKFALQCNECVTCGEYSSAYILLRSLNWSSLDFINLFSSNRYANDYIIKSLHNSLIEENGLLKYVK